MNTRSRTNLFALTALGAVVSASLAGQARAASLRGDINSDGYEDLIVGVSNEDVGAIEDAGQVHIILGSSTGLTEAGDMILTQDSVLGGTAIMNSAETDDLFGTALALGDFNGDGHSDLVVGAAFEDSGSTIDVGVVHVIYGSGTGLTGAGNAMFYHGTTNLLGDVQAHARFGKALAVGDFNGDGRDDLAIGSPEYDVNGLAGAGAVNVLYGSSSGLTTTNNAMFTQDSSGMLDNAEASEYFGDALSAGDFNGDGVSDLAVAVRGESVGQYYQAGAVHVIYGSYPYRGVGGGLTSTGNQLWHQDSPDVGGAIGVQDYFGEAVVSGDFDNDGIDELAIGSTEMMNGMYNVGSVTVLKGTGSGLTGLGSLYLHQDVAGVPGTNEAGDTFGRALAVGRFNDDGIEDLVIGAPCESVTGLVYEGTATLLLGSATGITTAGAQIWYQGYNGLQGTPAQHEFFGDAFAVGDFEGNGIDDLAIAASGQFVTSSGLAGAVHVLYGQWFGLSSFGNQLFTQDTAGIQDTAEPADYFGGALAH